MIVAWWIYNMCVRACTVNDWDDSTCSVFCYLLMEKTQWRLEFFEFWKRETKFTWKYVKSGLHWPLDWSFWVLNFKFFHSTRTFLIVLAFAFLFNHSFISNQYVFCMHIVYIIRSPIIRWMHKPTKTITKWCNSILECVADGHILINLLTNT